VRYDYRSGLTLVEFLIVIAIIGMVGSLLLSAFQWTRESAREARCLNNLRQIGQGIHAFHAVSGHFPTAGSCAEDFKTVPPAPYGFVRAGWGFQLLPFIEEDRLYQQALASDPLSIPPVGSRLVEAIVSIYTCPSRGPRSSTVGLEGIRFALGDYAGVVADYHFEWQVLEPARDEERTKTWRGLIAKGGHGTSRWTPVSAALVVDGLAHTVALVEKACSTEFYTAMELDWWEVPGWSHNADWATMRIAHPEGQYPPMLDSTPRPDADPFLIEAKTGRYKELGFGSSHPETMHAVFGDGSTRPLRYDVDPWVFSKLGNRNDGDARVPAGVD
jgi:prepilin-type N-terminal cleavage/methylation domain-containing protein